MSDIAVAPNRLAPWALIVFAALLVLVGHWVFLDVPLVGDEPADRRATGASLPEGCA